MQQSLLKGPGTNPQINNIPLQNILQALVRNIEQVPRGQCPLNELQLQFDKNNKDDVQQLKSLLSEYLSYPSTYISELHMNANRLGLLDVDELGDEEVKKKIKDAEACPCCGFFQQKSPLSIFTNIQDIKNLGVSTCYYFITLRNIIVLLILTFIIYCLYAIITNVIASDNYRSLGKISQNSLVSYQGILAVSLGSKQLNPTQGNRLSYTIQCWLGFGFLVLWAILFIFIKSEQSYKKKKIDSNAITASDFSILIKNFPVNMTKQELQSQLKQFCHQIGQNDEEKRLKIVKINKAVPFYLQKSHFEDERLEKLNQDNQKNKQKFISYIKQRIEFPQFVTPLKQRQDAKSDFDRKKTQREKLYKEIADKIKKQMKKTENLDQVPAFIIFQSSLTRQSIINRHRNSNSIINKICNRDQTRMYFHFRDKEGNIVKKAKIDKAPEPEDIIWTNLGQNSCMKFKKKLISNSITSVLLGVSFIVIFGLSKAQTDTLQKQVSTKNQYISILISLCISIFNIIIQQILRYLSILERCQTRTKHQTTLGMKAVFALLINSILIPILVNYFIKNNLYGINGLAEDVFYLGITNSFLNPILKLFDVYYYFTLLMKWYKSKPTNKLSLNQNQLNTITQYLQFQIGYQYIYMINLFLFTCFFAPLQPIIVLFAICGLFIMFWAQKFSLFRRCQRPVPGGSYLNNTMYQLIYFGPICYTLGSFCWSHFFPKSQFINIASNLASLVLSIIIFLLPYRTVANRLFQFQQQQQRIYQKNRIFLPSQYDRLNPATSAAAINQFRRYLTQKKQQLKHASESEIAQFEERVGRLYGVGNRRNQNDFIISQNIFSSAAFGLGFNRGQAFNDNNVVIQEVLGQENNVVSPFLLANAILFDRQQGINIAVQNWGVGQQVTYQNREGSISQLFTNMAKLGKPEQVTYEINNNNLKERAEQDVGNKLANLMMKHDYVHDNGGNTKGDNKKGYNSNAQNNEDSRHSQNSNIRGSMRNNPNSPRNIPINLFGNLLKVDNTHNYGNENSNNYTNQQNTVNPMVPLNLLPFPNINQEMNYAQGINNGFTYNAGPNRPYY